MNNIFYLINSVMGSSLSQHSAIETISQWRSKPANELIFDSSHREISQYMQAVATIQQSPNIKGSAELLAAAMVRLKGEFQAVLSRVADNGAGPSSVTEWSSIIDSTACAIRYEDYLVYEAPNKQIIIYLKNIAERMSINGNLEDCIKAYKIVRKKFIESQLRRVHFDELYLGENNGRFVWEDLKVKFEVWVPVSKICVEIFFEREKKLCEEIFSDLAVANNGATATDECFVGTVQDFVVRLFGFVKTVSESNQGYEKMRSVLGLYDVFWSVFEANDALFCCEAGESVRKFCKEILGKIEDDVKRMLYGFEKAVLNDSRDLDDKGAIHGLTEYAMNQVTFFVGKEKFLKNLIKSTPSLKFDNVVILGEELGDANFQTILDRHLILIVVVLLRNLEGKAKKCKDPILGNVFVMNNVRFIVQKIEASSELQVMIGDKLREKVEVAMTSYRTSTCNKFLTCFRDEGLYNARCFSRRLSKTTLKRRMEAFNKVFGEIQALHSVWKIPDSLLRENVRSSMSETLVPAYRVFLEKFKKGVENKSLKGNSIKYSAEDLRTLMLEKLFEASY